VHAVLGEGPQEATDVFAPADYFDLGRWAHRGLFDDAEFVWQVLARLPGYMASVLGFDEADADAARGAIRVGEGALVEQGAIVIGPAMIGPGCRIYAGSLVRGPIILGAGCLVGHGSEVLRSVVLDGAHMAHLNYVADSLVGADVNLGAGAVCSNLKLGEGVVKVRAGGAEHDTGLPKFGAVLGDGVKAGCHVVFNPGTLVGPRTWVYPGACLRGVYRADCIVKVRQTLEISERRRDRGEKA
jgi:NDP-sugar pyrophosphorylase family protein